MHLVLCQPEIPQNVGTLARMGACLGISLHLIGPLGFVLSDRRLVRAGMDYLQHTALTLHPSWEAFRPFLNTQRSKGGRLVSLSAGASQKYIDFSFHAEDMLCAGSESAGLETCILEQSEARLKIPMPGGGRSLNLAVACALVTSEILRQTNGFHAP